MPPQRISPWRRRRFTIMPRKKLPRGSLHPPTAIIFPLYIYLPVRLNRRNGHFSLSFFFLPFSANLGFSNKTFGGIQKKKMKKKGKKMIFSGHGLFFYLNKQICRYAVAVIAIQQKKGKKRLPILPDFFTYRGRDWCDWLKDSNPECELGDVMSGPAFHRIQWVNWLTCKYYITAGVGVQKAAVWEFRSKNRIFPSVHEMYSKNRTNYHMVCYGFGSVWCAGMESKSEWSFHSLILSLALGWCKKRYRTML